MKIVIGSIALQCAVAIWLILSPPENLLWRGIILSGLALLAIGAALFSLYRHRNRMYVLHERVQACLRNGTDLPYSLREDAYAELENDIAEMAHRIRVQQERMARENRKAADFISDVSHQLKTPLAALKLYCEMRDQPEKQLILIEQMEALIYSLLRLQKLNAGAYEMRFAFQDMAGLIMEVIQELSILYPYKRFMVDARCSAFRFDEYWMGEAIKNVLKNACEHTSGDGEIRVGMVRNEKIVTITVQDDGGGVAVDELPLLFKRFYRSSAQRSGTGLGLAITRSIIERHHGTISAQNAGNGLRITICLPLLSGKLPVS